MPPTWHFTLTTTLMKERTQHCSVRIPTTAPFHAHSHCIVSQRISSEPLEKRPRFRTGHTSSGRASRNRQARLLWSVFTGGTAHCVPTKSSNPLIVYSGLRILQPSLAELSSKSHQPGPAGALSHNEFGNSNHVGHQHKPTIDYCKPRPRGHSHSSRVLCSRHPSWIHS